MVTPVGYDAPSSCAAIRCGLDNFGKTGFRYGGEWLKGASVLLPKAVGGVEKFPWMVTRAIHECFGSAPGLPGDTAIALCVSEEGRPGKMTRFDERFFANVCARVPDAERLGPHRRLIARGALGGVEALQWAQQVLSAGDARFCLIAGVDTYLHGPTLAGYHAARRLVSETNTDGFLPGEAATAVMVAQAGTAASVLDILGIGWGRERATQDSGEPLRGDGLAMAYRAAFKAAGCGFPDVHYRLADIGGDQYSFKEAALAILRTLRVTMEEFYLWHPADCVGRVGAASVPLILGVAADAAAKSYAPGSGCLCHFTDPGEIRAAVVVRQPVKHERESIPPASTSPWSLPPASWGLR